MTSRAWLVRELIENRAWRLVWFDVSSKELDRPGPQIHLLKQYLPLALDQLEITPAQYEELCKRLTEEERG